MNELLERLLNDASSRGANLPVLASAAAEEFAPWADVAAG
jgi:hypothetical protein